MNLIKKLFASFTKTPADTDLISIEDLHSDIPGNIFENEMASPAPEQKPKTVKVRKNLCEPVGEFLEQDVIEFDSAKKLMPFGLINGLEFSEKISALFGLMIARGHNGDTELTITTSYVDDFLPAFLISVESNIGEYLNIIQVGAEEFDPETGLFSAVVNRAFADALPTLPDADKAWLVAKFEAGEIETADAVRDMTVTLTEIIEAGEGISDREACLAILATKEKAGVDRNRFRKSKAKERVYSLPYQVLAERTGASERVCHFVLQRAMTLGYIESGFLLNAVLTSDGKALMGNLA